MARRFIAVAGTPQTNSNDLLFCTYNILADSNITPTLYPYTPDWILNWQDRRGKLVRELCSVNADLFCLQEIEDFEAFVLPALRRKGYDAIVHYRTTKKDGCAIVFKTSRLQSIEYQPIKFQISEVMDRDNVGQTILFLDKKTSKKILVANTHLLFNPKRGDIKLGQLAMMLDAIAGMKMKLAPDAIIFAGDFNCCPQSPMHRLLRNGRLSLDGEAKYTMSGQIVKNQGGRKRFKLAGPPPPLAAVEESVIDLDTSAVGISVDSASSRLPRKGDVFTLPAGIPLRDVEYCAVENHISHSLNFKSAYETALGGEPEYTTITHEGKKCVDYIWVAENISVVGVWEMLPPKIAAPFRGGLPTKFSPSDHVPLIARLRLV